jgi:hypothetical protein
LNYIIAGFICAFVIGNQAQAMGEKSIVEIVKTVNGQELKASIENGKVILAEAKGGKATVVAADLTYAGYNTPYQFVGRKNEIIVSVKWN